MDFFAKRIIPNRTYDVPAPHTTPSSRQLQQLAHMLVTLKKGQ